MIMKELFNCFKKIDDKLSGDILEISVRQHQITISLKDSLTYFNDVEKLLVLYTSDNSYITTKNDIIYITFADISPELLSKTSDLYLFMKVIGDISDKVCACPSLEFVISKEYIKCFLDKPGLRVSDLLEYENILEAEGKGELELHPQRAYLLFINENFEV